VPLGENQKTNEVSGTPHDVSAKRIAIVPEPQVSHAGLRHARPHHIAVIAPRLAVVLDGPGPARSLGAAAVAPRSGRGGLAALFWSIAGSKKWGFGTKNGVFGTKKRVCGTRILVLEAPLLVPKPRFFVHVFSSEGGFDTQKR
jgi:hypothetical protein